MEKHFTGYHGTVKSNVASIKSNGFRVEKYSFITSELQKVPGDLGAGVYAYKDSIENAKKFAEKFSDDISVLKLEIVVDEDRFMDMDEESNSSLILEVYNDNKVFNQLKERYMRTNKSAKSRECLDGLVLEHIIHKYRIPVDLVKKETYTRFKDLPPISHYFNGTELCIKNKKIIKKVSEESISNTCRSGENGN
ncbi:hypothetical protein [Sporosarcina sp. USHLN248]|uniref:hypothetical protein n=1 Tax=Sporosarcina sp. USHLN248 TaxID=3081300 RepID=UPI00301A8642